MNCSPMSSVMKTRLTMSRTLLIPLVMRCQKSLGRSAGMYMMARYDTPEPVSPYGSISSAHLGSGVAGNGKVLTLKCAQPSVSALSSLLMAL